MNRSDVVHYLAEPARPGVLACAVCHEAHTVPSWQTETPGLVVLDTSASPCARVCTRPFSITHARSGLLVAAAESIDQALDLARALADVPGVDWTAEGWEVQAAGRRARDVFAAIVGDHGPSGSHKVTDAPADVADRYLTR